MKNKKEYIRMLAKVSVLVIFIITTLIFQKMYKDRIEITYTDLINSNYYLNTEVLEPESSLNFCINSREETLEKIEIAFDYEIEKAKQTKMRIEVINNENVLVFEEIAMQLVGDRKLMAFQLPKNKKHQGEYIVKIKNISEKENAFSLLMTDNKVNFSEKVTKYSIDGIEYDGQLISRYTYFKQYNYYIVVVFMFVIIMNTIMLILILKDLMKIIKLKKIEATNVNND